MAFLTKTTCLWCGTPMLAKTKAKFLDTGYCHVQFHRFRTKHYPDLSPSEFKKLILEMFKEGKHPNPRHPLSLLNQANEQFEDVLKKREENAE